MSNQINLYTTTIPPMIHALHSLNAILTKTQSHITATKIPESFFLSNRLYPDMHPLAPQIQRVSDTARGLIRRISPETPNASLLDTETSIEELKTRIEKTIEILEGVKEEDLVGKDEKDVELMVGTGAVGGGGSFTWKAPAWQYATFYAVPNFYFHVTVAYAILRNAGVEIGKNDFLGTERVVAQGGQEQSARS